MPGIFIKILAWFNAQPDINRMGFLSSFFKVTPESFTDATEVELDLVRSGEEVAPAITNLSTGAVSLAVDVFDLGKAPFPVYALDRTVHVGELMNRQPGENAYDGSAAGDWLGRLARVLVGSFTRMTDMVKRSIELQAAQVLQTGTIDLTNEDGKIVYKLDLKPKPSHFPTVSKSWGTPDADPISDIAAVADIVRNDGLVDVCNLIMDNKSFDNFIKNERVKEFLKTDGLRLGALNPKIVGKGAKYYGYMHIGSGLYDIWIYSATYNEFGKKETKKFLEDNKVLFLPDFNDLDFRRLFGGIPMVRPESNTAFDQLFGASKVTIDNEYDFKARVYWDEKAEAYTGEIKSRPLCLPVSIDRFACLTTQA